MKLSLEEKFRLLTAKDAWTTQDFGGKIKKRPYGGRAARRKALR